jgi:hypothetical protein
MPDTKTPPPATTPPEVSEPKGFFSKFIETIKREINDLSYLEIITAAGEPKTTIDPNADDIVEALKTIKEINILARTRLELDGDITVILPTDKDGVKINNEIMAIHKENVDTAVKNWQDFVHNILAALDLLIQITGLPKADVLGHFSTPTPPAPSPAPPHS